VNNLSAIVFGLLSLALATLTAPAASPQPDLTLQIYFAGAQRISADAHARAFTNEFTYPEALALRAEAATKLSRWLSGWLQTNVNAAGPDGEAKLRPLFDDLQRSEFGLQIWAAPDGQSETAIAIRLDSARAQLWQANLKPFFPRATFKSAGGWLIVDSNPKLLAAGDKLEQNVTTPDVNWLDVYLNWPRLAQGHPGLQALGLPAMEFHVKPSGESLATTGKFGFPGKLDLHLDPWQMPTNVLHAPFDSFTATRGFSSWLQSQNWAQAWQLSPMPNQLFLWALPGLPFQSFAATPVPNATTAIAQTFAHVQTAIKAASGRGELMTPVRADMSGSDIVVNGVPFMSLRVQPLSDPTGRFLIGELFPNPSHGLPLPPGLLARLATPNLVYYHWEITADRVPQLLQITQLSLMVTQHKQLDGKSAAYKWLRKAGTTPGASETGITQTGPAEFTFQRQGPGLFTAFELFALANWLEAGNFPGCDLKAAPLTQSTPATQLPLRSSAQAPKTSH
jgi:hypothetical protein